MKKAILIALGIIIATGSFSQSTAPIPELTKQDYLQKSKTQKTTAWVLLGGGSALVVAGLINYGNKVQNTDNPFEVFDTGELGLSVAGTIVLISSIPLFIASSKNKQKAMKLSFNRQKIPALQKNSLVSRAIPSLQLSIRF